MLEAIWEAIHDSLKVFPVLFVVYIIIEIIEDKSSKNVKHDKHLSSKFSPVIASTLGIVPQCGFSVIATDLFAKRKIAMGTLLAVFIATSDEAIPIMISNKNSIVPMFIMLGIKLVYAILVGFIVNYIYNKIKLKKIRNNFIVSEANKTFFVFKSCVNIDFKNKNTKKYLTPVIVSCEDINKPNVCDIGCCGHNIEKDPSTLKKFIYHPLIHSLKIFAFILIFNLAFEILLYFVGEGAIEKFMVGTSIFQPFVVSIVGMIPNCVASVAISQLFVDGLITFGSCVAGLCANAGIALAVLFKQNPSKAENFTIIGLLYVLSSVLGFVIDLF